MVDHRQAEFRRISKDSVTSHREFVAIESYQEIWIEDIQVGRILCSPSDSLELGLGYLLSSGFLKWDEEYDIDIQDNHSVVLRSSNKNHIIQRFLSAKIEPVPQLNAFEDEISVLSFEVLSGLAERLRSSRERLQIKHMTYAALLYDTASSKSVLASDIERYNSLYKVIGSAKIQGLNPTYCVLLLEEDITSTHIEASANSNIPLVGSLGGATDVAIHLSMNVNMTLVGDLCSNRLLVYNEGAIRLE